MKHAGVGFLKVLEKNFKKGFVKVVPKTLDDLWHLYNVIYKGDQIHSRTTRQIKPDAEYARPRRGQRITVFVGVKDKKVIWDKLLGRVRVHGTISECPETVPKGAYQTITKEVLVSYESRELQ